MGAAQKTTQGGTRETIESIVIALVIAFVFRTFIVEAFVIPTGSMAPTLMGAHTRVTCSDCGWEYDVNAGGSQQGPGGELVIDRTSGPTRTFCPNCGYRDDAEKRDIFYGDRILVLKYAHLLQSPRRWDVTVFKSPSEPQKYGYQQNYIKRLVGTPGEQLMLLDGDVYVTHAPKPTDRDWEIQRKPDAVQQSLWRIVHDMDHDRSPADPENGRPRSSDMLAAMEPWRASGEGLTLKRDGTGARGYSVDAAATPVMLRFDPSVSPTKRALSDWLAYDQNAGRSNPVGDLKLSLFYQRLAGEGELRLHLGKRQDLFIAAISPGKVSLLHQVGSDEWTQTVLQSKSLQLPDRPVRVEFINLDYRVRLLVDGQEVLSTSPQQYRPDVTALKAEEQSHESPRPNSAVYITAKEQTGRLTHMSLWRDIYYVTDDAAGKILRATSRNPVKLGPDEYFMLGDNSALSLDGRYWDEAIGLPGEGLDVSAGVVPGRFLLGRAIFVYWPAGFRPVAASPVDLIPNFGEMRFIH